MTNSLAVDQEPIITGEPGTGKELIGHFLQQLCQQAERPEPKLSPDLRRFLESHDWPGNVWQLRNWLESMVVLAAGDTLTMDNLPAAVENQVTPADHLAIPPWYDHRGH